MHFAMVHHIHLKIALLFYHNVDSNILLTFLCYFSILSHFLYKIIFLLFALFLLDIFYHYLINIYALDTYLLLLFLDLISCSHNLLLLHLLVLNIYMDNILVLMYIFHLVPLFLNLQTVLCCLFLCSQNNILTCSYLTFFQIFLVLLLILLYFYYLLCLLYTLFCLYNSFFVFLIL